MEKAARGTDGRTYPWGEGMIDATYANYASSGVGDTTPVDNYEKGKSPYGVYNMAGNVFEWVADWYSDTYYSTYPIDQWPSNPTGPEIGDARVQRGGAMGSNDNDVRSTVRTGNHPTDESYSAGFRCVRDISP